MTRWLIAILMLIGWVQAPHALAQTSSLGARKRQADVGKTVAMLACADLPFSTGEVINVDGGLHLRKL